VTLISTTFLLPCRSSPHFLNQIRGMLLCVSFWLRFRARMIKKDDKTPENRALIRKAIEGYEGLLKDLQLKLEEKKQIDSSLLHLYDQLGEEELKQELLSRGADPNRTPGERADAFVLLAAKAWDCSFKITSSQANKDVTLIAQAKVCATDGLRFSNRALTLDPKSETAWSYKTNLLLEASKIAGLEGDASEKISYLKQYEESLKKRAADVNNNAASSEDHFTLTEIVKHMDLAKEAEDLLEFKAENTLDKVASDLLPFPVELTLLLGPTSPGSDNDATASSRSSLARQKRDWKTLTVAEDLTLDLPDNASSTITGYETGYEASSEGVIYSVISTDRNPLQALRTLGDRTMNVMVRNYVGPRSRAWLAGGYGNTYEMKFLRREISNGRPRNIYSYSLQSCSERKEGVLLVQASQSHLYIIDISGATDSHASVQHVLSSIKVK
jgi:hypothetical protein